MWQTKYKINTNDKKISGSTSIAEFEVQGKMILQYMYFTLS